MFLWLYEVCWHNYHVEQNHESGGVSDLRVHQKRFAKFTREDSNRISHKNQIVLQQFEEKNGVMSFIVMVFHCWTLIDHLSSIQTESCLLTCSLSPFVAMLASVENSSVPPLSVYYPLYYLKAIVFIHLLSSFLFWNVCGSYSLFS